VIAGSTIQRQCNTFRTEFHIPQLNSRRSSFYLAVRPLGTLLATAIVVWLGLPRSVDHLMIPAAPVEDVADTGVVSGPSDGDSAELATLEENYATHVWLDASEPSSHQAAAMPRHAFAPQHTPFIVVPPPRLTPVHGR
jgi:hypothetical protein